MVSPSSEVVFILPVFFLTDSQKQKSDHETRQMFQFIEYFVCCILQSQLSLI